MLITPTDLDLLMPVTAPLTAGARSNRHGGKGCGGRPGLWGKLPSVGMESGPHLMGRNVDGVLVTGACCSRAMQAPPRVAACGCRSR